MINTPHKPQTTDKTTNRKCRTTQTSPNHASNQLDQLPYTIAWKDNQKDTDTKTNAEYPSEKKSIIQTRQINRQRPNNVQYTNQQISKSTQKKRTSQKPTKTKQLQMAIPNQTQPTQKPRIPKGSQQSQALRGKPPP